MAAGRTRAGRSHRGDGRTLRRTRLRLALWSAAITFVVVVLMGATLHLVVARQLAQDSEAQLRARAAALTSDPFFTSMASLSGVADIPVTDSSESPGLVLGGPFSGTVATLIDLEPGALEPGMVDLIGVDIPIAVGVIEGSGQLGEAEGLASADGEERIVLAELDGTPIRLLTVPVETSQGTSLAQVFSDRSAEVGTLESLFLVLLVAVPLVALAAGMAGWLYSGRALVPIRQAMDRQRQFAADASHELRTPLTVLSGNLHALSTLDRDSPASDEALTDAVAETNRMTALLDDLLLLARTDAEAFPVEIAQMDLADEALEAMEGLAPRAQTRSVSLVLDAQPTPMHGDAQRLRQLVVILVDNAIGHGSVGGHIWLTVGLEGRSARLSVADDGPGIAAADREHVFDRFWRGPGDDGDGSGLGLAIARWIVTAHDGGIAVDERPGGGARFEVSLPARRSSGPFQTGTPT